MGTEQFLQSGHFILEVTHQLIVGILINDSIAFDVLGPVSVTKIKIKKLNSKLYLEGLENLNELECEELSNCVILYVVIYILNGQFTGVC